MYALPAAASYTRGAPLVGVKRRLGIKQDVALTFDDGPQPGATEYMATMLHDLGVRATFFMVGEHVRRHPSLVREVQAAGHVLGNHGFRHQNHLLRNPLEIVGDIHAGAHAIADVGGEWPNFFRPPQGVVTALTRYGAWRIGSAVVLWDAWGRDWRPQATVESIEHDVLLQARGGSIILLHDGDRYGSCSWHATYSAVPRIVAAMRERDLNITCLSHANQLDGGTA